MSWFVQKEGFMFTNCKHRGVGDRFNILHGEMVKVFMSISLRPGMLPHFLGSLTLKYPVAECQVVKGFKKDQHPPFSRKSSPNVSSLPCRCMILRQVFLMKKDFLIFLFLSFSGLF